MNRNGAATLTDTFIRQAGEPPACFAFEGFTEGLFATGSFSSGGFAFGDFATPTPIVETERNRLNLMLFNRHALTGDDAEAVEARLNLMRYNLNRW